jgi:hypothetical protein
MLEECPEVEGFFFFEKKKQKTFGPCRWLTSAHPTARTFFLAVFFKKEHAS